jgi:type II secretory pathway component PulJ
MKARHQKSIRKQSGFTLAEVVVASTISVLVIMVSTQLLLTIVKVEAKSANNYVMDSESVEFVRQFSGDVLAAQTVVASTQDKIELTLLRFGGNTESVKYQIEQDSDPEKENRYSLRRYSNANGQNDHDNIVNDIVEYSFNYYDYTKKTTDNPKDIRYLQIVMQLARTSNSKTYSRKVVTPWLLLRNKQIAE